MAKLASALRGTMTCLTLLSASPARARYPGAQIASIMPHTGPTSLPSGHWSLAALSASQVSIS